MIKQGDLVDIEIVDISSQGYGIGKIEQQVIFVPDTVTGDRISSRIVRVKKKYAEGKLVKVNQRSPHRIRPRCIVADKCGGCQWQHIDYNYQASTKENQVKETLTRIGNFNDFAVQPILFDQELGYRNKVNYPLGISQKGNLKTGYYEKGTHNIVNINQCPVQDERLNPLLPEIKQDLQNLGIRIYSEKNGKGELRHLCFRIGQETGEILLTLVSAELSDDRLEQQAQQWFERYPQLVGVCLNHNPQKTNVIFGKKTQLLVGRDYIQEIFADLNFHLRPETFFQINTAVAQILLDKVMERLNLQGTETILDLYSGIGTFTLPLAKKVKKVIGIESHVVSVEQAKHNAEVNQIENVEFLAGLTEEILPTLEILYPDVVILDPPRKGCQTEVIETLINFKTETIVYFSCHPATLARDLKLLCQDSNYQITWVQPADFFPQTPHVETAVILRLA